MEVKYTEASQSDIESIYEYIARAGGIASADRIIEAVTATCGDLGEFPGMGRRRPELDDLDREVRSISERGYVILYTEHEGQIWIVRVVHGARDIGPELLEPLTEIA